MVERKRLCARVGIKIFLKALKTFFVGENVCVCVCVCGALVKFVDGEKKMDRDFNFVSRQRETIWLRNPPGK